MKERRRLRKLRGRASSSTGGGALFTGLGSHPGGANSWSDHSIPDDHTATVGGSLNTAASNESGQSSIQMSVLSSSSLTSDRLEPTSSPLLPQDSDESRFAGMASEDIEEELERAEQKRELEERKQQPI
jgi:hypothetical protein